MMHFDAFFGPGCGGTDGKGHHCWELDDDDGWWWWQLSRSISDKCTKKKKQNIPAQTIHSKCIIWALVVDVVEQDVGKLDDGW